MKNAIRTTLTAAALLAAAALPAAAQESEPGRPASISLNSGGGTAVGAWIDGSPNLRYGIEVGGFFQHTEADTENEDEQDSHTLSVTPAVKVFRGEGEVRPYTLVGVRALQYGSEATDDAGNRYSTRTRAIGPLVGLGLEWRVHDRAAVGGHLGVSAAYHKTEVESREDEVFTQAEGTGWEVETVNSGIVVHLFF